MTRSGLGGLVLDNLSRNARSVAMSSVGIIVGISALVFFVGLSEGIKEVVLKRIFLIDQVEVIPPKVGFGVEQLGALFGAKPANDKLTDALTAEFAGVEGVEGAYPKMKFTFPAFAYGGKELLGRDVRGELIADGLEPALVRAELPADARFEDLEAPAPCAGDDACVGGSRCVEGACAPEACSLAKGAAPTCGGGSYCAEQLGAAAEEGRCLQPIPVILNEQLLELYNGGIAVALGRGGSLPKVSKELVVGFGFNVELNRSAIMRTRGASLARRVKVVGFSDKAMQVGVTLPIGYVRRLNASFTSPEAAARYHSVILKVRDQTRFPELVEEVRRRGLALADKTSNAEQASKIIKTVEGLFALVSLLIVGIAAVNISQMFYMLIYQRRREIGLLRALGASEGDLKAIILGEAASIGLLGGALGALVGLGAAAAVDAVAANLPRFPYKPESFFVFPAWVWPAALVAAVAFCVTGAFFPARAAARQEPAEALTQ
ncbi:MAG: FtsX-like permease family protein [Deltaproteobacteria bacterium]|nr:FtsX-like permease family protein [Deltaproteobacteria bacterium]